MHVLPPRLDLELANSADFNTSDPHAYPPLPFLLISLADLPITVPRLIVWPTTVLAPTLALSNFPLDAPLPRKTDLLSSLSGPA